MTLGVAVESRQGTRDAGKHQSCAFALNPPPGEAVGPLSGFEVGDDLSNDGVHERHASASSSGISLSKPSERRVQLIPAGLDTANRLNFLEN